VPAAVQLTALPAPVLTHCSVFPAGILRLLRDLDVQARKAGGAVYMLNGNHESLNVCGDFRWAPSPLTVALRQQL
jgi:hypothetical protein